MWRGSPHLAQVAPRGGLSNVSAIMDAETRALLEKDELQIAEMDRLTNVAHMISEQSRATMARLFPMIEKEAKQEKETSGDQQG